MEIIKSIISPIYSVYIWLVNAMMFVIHYVVISILIVFRQSHFSRVYQLAKVLLQIGLKMTGIEAKRVGDEHVLPKGPFIVVANHESFLDTVLIMCLLPIQVQFFAKKELFKVPVLGTTMRRLQHFKVDRSNPKKASQSVKQAESDIKKGANLLIFPEGTRSKDGEIAAFKRGPFLMAVHTEATIVPCWIKGTRNILPKGDWRAWPGKVELHIGKAIHVDPSSSESEKALSQELQKVCEAQIKEMKEIVSKS